MRFVILIHDHPFLHWDLMLEDEDSLVTFRLLREPTCGVELPAEPLTSHRKAYLDYEGPVSGGRGTVTRWDAGICRCISRSESRQAWELTGTRVAGQVTLQESSGGWTCTIDAV